MWKVFLKLIRWLVDQNIKTDKNHQLDQNVKNQNHMRGKNESMDSFLTASFKFEYEMSHFFLACGTNIIVCGRTEINDNNKQEFSS